MKLSFSSLALKKALSISMRGVPAKNETILPMLRTVRISYKDGMAVLETTRLSVSIRVLVVGQNGELSDPAPVCIDCIRLYEIVGTIDSGDITLEDKKDAIVVKAGKFKSELTRLDAEEFPNIVFSQDTSYTVNSAELNSAIQFCSFQGKKAEDEFDLPGLVSFDMHNDILQVTRTDKSNLAISTMVARSLKEENYNDVVQAKNISKILGVFSSENLYIYSSENTLTIFDQSVCVVMQKSEVSFPDIAHIVAGGNNLDIYEFDCRVLVGVIRRSMVMAELLTIDFSNGKTNIDSHGGEDIGHFNCEDDIIRGDKPFNHILDASLLLYALEHMEQPKLKTSDTARFIVVCDDSKIFMSSVYQMS